MRPKSGRTACDRVFVVLSDNFLKGNSVRVVLNNTSPTFGARRSEPPISPLLQNTPESPASDEFVQEVNRAIHTLPDFLQTAWQEAEGGAVRVGKFLTDIFPALKDVTPRGWDEWTTWDNSDAIGGLETGMAEYTWALTERPPSVFDAGRACQVARVRFVEPPVFKPGNRLCKSTAPAPLFRHEAGHTFDDIMGEALRNQQFFRRRLKKTQYISETKSFHKAYQKDFRRLSQKEKEVSYYFIQPDSKGQPTAAGHSEAFAESLANLYGGGCWKQRAFKKRFKHTIAFVRQSVGQFERQRRLNRTA